jgi:outer membrane protein assembly factor BamB
MRQYQPFHLRQCILAGALVALTLFTAACTSLSSTATTAPTATPPPSTPHFVYVVATTGASQTASVALYALQASTGAIAWHMQLTSALVARYPALADASTVYVSTTNGTDGLLTAYVATSGQHRWTTTFAHTTFTLLANQAGVLVGLKGNTQLVGLQASDGSQLWQVTVPKTFAFDITVGSGTVYAYAPSPVNELLAYRISDGTALWHTAIDRPLDTFGASPTTVFATFFQSNNRQPIGGVAAYSAATGARQWEKTTSGQYFIGTVQADVVYVAVGPLNVLAGNHVRALKGSDGSQLWQLDPSGGVAYNQIEASDAQNLYVMSSPPSPSESTPLPGPTYLSAIQIPVAGTPTVRWKKPLQTFGSVAAGNGTLYLGSPSSSPQGNAIQAFDAASGTAHWTYHVIDSYIAQLVAGP